MRRAASNRSRVRCVTQLVGFGRLGGLVVLAAASLALFAAPAQATFHLQKVNEVMLSSASGDTNAQFVELFDPSSEPFPPFSAPYKLVVFDAAGSKLGEHALNATGMANASRAGRPYLVSTAAADSALGVTGDEVLDVTLPPTGQACYTAGSSDTPYSCITWGCISKAVSASSGTGTAQGAAPPAGMSAQRQSDDSIQIAAPTPKAANRSGTASPACPTTGGPGSTPPVFKGVALASHKAKVSSKGVAPVKLRCPSGTGTCTGRITLKARGSTAGSARFTIAAGATRTVKVKLKRSARNTLASRGRLTTKASIAAAAGSQTKRTSGKLVLTASRR